MVAAIGRRMPAAAREDLIQAILSAVAESGASAVLASSPHKQPRHFVVSGAGAPPRLTIYAWTLTFGGRQKLAHEYRIQMTSVASPLQAGQDGPTLLLGYEPALNLFAGFDFARHRVFTAGSPSVQIDRSALARAEADGLSFHRKSNGEIAVGIRPDLFLAYALHAGGLHRLGADIHAARLLERAVVRPALTGEEPAALPPPRTRVIAEISRLSRDAAFRRRVLFAYGQRCAVTRMQLRLVEAAHILPVGAPGSSDEVQNGIALSPTFHRAYDAGLIFLDERYMMRLHEPNLQILRQANLSLGVELLREHLDREIFLPPDPSQRPRLENIRRANVHRRIT